MGIYDRGYYQDEQRGFTLGRPRSIVITLILINVGLWLANVLFTPNPGNQITDFLAVHGDTVARPYMWWQMLTYGFAHSPTELMHLLGNMLGLFFLGRAIEQEYGSKEFLRLYLALVVFGGIIWAVSTYISGPRAAMCVGASGAVVGIVVLFALRFPKQTLHIWGILPIPAWVLGVLIVASDLFGAAGASGEGGVAYQVHLAGAALAFCYHRFNWNFTRMTGKWSSNLQRRRGPKLRVHDPGSERPSKEDDLKATVDKILQKITDQGKGSLTRKERRILEDASRSRAYQKQRQDPDNP